MFKVLSYVDLPNTKKLNKIKLRDNLLQTLEKISYYENLYITEYPQIIDYDLIIYVISDIIEHEDYLGHVESTINSYRAITDYLEKPTILVTTKEIMLDHADLDELKKNNEEALCCFTSNFDSKLEKYIRNFNPEKILVVFTLYDKRYNIDYLKIYRNILKVMKSLNHEPEDN